MHRPAPRPVQPAVHRSASPPIQRRAAPNMVTPFSRHGRPLAGPGVGVIQAYRRTLDPAPLWSDPNHAIPFTNLHPGTKVFLVSDVDEIPLNLGFGPQEQWIEVMHGNSLGYILLKDYNRNTRQIKATTPMFDSMKAAFTPVLPAGTRVDINELESLHGKNVGVARPDKWVMVEAQSGEKGWVRRRQLSPQEVLDEETAKIIFEALRKGEFTSTSGEKGRIPFQYPVDGCYARAEAMVRLMDQWEVPSQKLFAVAAGNSQLRVQTPYGPDCFYSSVPSVTWSYHVAPIVTLENGTNLVLDPSVASKPLKIHEWIGLMGNFNTFTQRTLHELQQEKQPGGNPLDINQYYVLPNSYYFPSKYDGLSPLKSSSVVYSGPSHGSDKMMEFAKGPLKLHLIAARLRNNINIEKSKLIELIGELMPDDPTMVAFQKAFPYLFNELKLKLGIL